MLKMFGRWPLCRPCGPSLLRVSALSRGCRYRKGKRGVSEKFKVGLIGALVMLVCLGIIAQAVIDIMRAVR